MERFQLTVFLVVIGLRNLLAMSTEFSLEYLYSTLLFQLLAVLISELGVDWVKHAYITKFNRLRPAAVYSCYIDILCGDLRRLRKDIGGSSSRVARRMGFAVLPLACMVLKRVYVLSHSLSQVIRMMIHTIDSAALAWTWQRFSTALVIYLR